MTKYERERQGIWMIQVRPKDSNTIWGVTGPDYFFHRKDAVKSITPSPWQNLEYRVVRYLPAEAQP